jgi:hypothetical protein
MEFKIADGNNKNKGKKEIKSNRIKSILFFSLLKMLMYELSI